MFYGFTPLRVEVKTCVSPRESSRLGNSTKSRLSPSWFSFSSSSLLWEEQVAILTKSLFSVIRELDYDRFLKGANLLLCSLRKLKLLIISILNIRKFVMPFWILSFVLCLTILLLNREKHALDVREIRREHAPSILLFNCFVFARTQQPQIIDEAEQQSRFLWHWKTIGWAGIIILHKKSAQKNLIWAHLLLMSLNKDETALHCTVVSLHSKSVASIMKCHGQLQSLGLFSHQNGAVQTLYSCGTS